VCKYSRWEGLYCIECGGVYDSLEGTEMLYLYLYLYLYRGLLPKIILFIMHVTPSGLATLFLSTIRSAVWVSLDGDNTFSLLVYDSIGLLARYMFLELVGYLNGKHSHGTIHI
jgi:hypothetical protein